MTIYWVRAESDQPLEVMAAVERALVANDTNTPPLPATAARDLFAGDTYLAENLDLARSTWSVDTQRIAESRLPLVGAILNRAQGLARRATAWYGRPQWQQVTTFHGAVVRVIDSLMAHQQRLHGRVQALENLYLLTHIESIEQQLAALRRERVELLERIEALEKAEGRRDRRRETGDGRRETRI